MTKIRAAITGVGGYVPDYILTNDELSKMVDTSDEWIMQRVGIKERRILREKGKATSDLASNAIRQLLQKTNTDPKDIDLLIFSTITPDMRFPSAANMTGYNVGLINAFTFDLNAACSGFIYGLEVTSRLIESGSYKKAILVGADMMSSITDYTDRKTCPLFGDAAAAVMVEPSENGYGIIDRNIGYNGIGRQYLFMKAGGSLNPPSHETIDNKEHFVYQDGKTVFKFAVEKMSDISAEIMQKNNVIPNENTWLVPHQANLRIIEAVAKRMGIDRKHVLINIERFGNTTAATIPLCFWDFEKQLKKGDDVIITAFGAGFTWGTIYIKWAYSSN